MKADYTCLFATRFQTDVTFFRAKDCGKKDLFIGRTILPSSTVTFISKHLEYVSISSRLSNCINFLNGARNSLWTTDFALDELSTPTEASAEDLSIVLAVLSMSAASCCIYRINSDAISGQLKFW